MSSRPRFWMYTFGPYILASLFVQPNWYWLVCLLYFVYPANVLIYGVNDLADRDTDKHNPKKDGYETRLTDTTKTWVKVSIALILGLILLALADHPLFFALFLLLGIGYSVPPLRFKAVPFIDSLSNILYAMPGFFAYHNFTGQLPNLWIVLAAMFWCAGMHLYSALPDIASDKKANVKTTGVLLGTHAYTMTSVYWLLALVSLSMVAPWTAWLPLVVYVMIPFAPIDTFKMYKLFPYVNTWYGAILFFSLASLLW